MTTPRKHHTVPRSILRQFALAGTHRVFAYDKADQRSFPLSVEDAAAERDFYAVEVDGQRFSWEPAFQSLDDRLAECLRDIAAAKGPHVPADVQRDLPLMVATQLLRTRLQRTTVEALANQLRDLTLALGSTVTTFTDAGSRLQHFQQLLDIRATATRIASKDFLLLQSHGSAKFFISDNPVVLHNSFPYGRIGLDAPGIEIYMPIGPCDCLAFLCPSVRRQIAESLDPHHSRPSLRDPLFPRMLAAFGSQNPLEVPPSYVELVNGLQVAQSSRFLYAGESIKAWVEAYFAPNVVQSLLRIGRPGEAPPTLTQMPAGAFLIVERGTNHHALHVTDLTHAAGGDFVVATTDLQKLALLQADSPFDSVTLVVDGQQLRGAREVLLEATIQEGAAIVAVRHADSGLQSLMGHLRSRRPST